MRKQWLNLPYLWKRRANVQGCVGRPACCPVPDSQGLSPGVCLLPGGERGQSSAEQRSPLGHVLQVGPAGIISFAQICSPQISLFGSCSNLCHTWSGQKYFPFKTALWIVKTKTKNNKAVFLTLVPKWHNMPIPFRYMMEALWFVTYLFYFLGPVVLNSFAFYFYHSLMLLLLIYLFIFALGSEFQMHPNYVALWVLSFIEQTSEFSIINMTVLWQHSLHVFHSWRVTALSNVFNFFFFKFWLETSLSKTEEQFVFSLLL